MVWNNDDETGQDGVEETERDGAQETEQDDVEEHPQTWVLLREVGTEIEAMLIAGRLHSARVPAQVLSQVDSTRNFTVGALAIAKVYVPASMLARAEEVLGSDDELPDMSDNTGTP